MCAPEASGADADAAAGVVEVRALGAGDLAAIAVVLAEAADYALLADGHPPGPEAAQAFLDDAAPGCDPAQGCQIGLMHAGRLSGLMGLSFGFPAPGDAYLGLMLLVPKLRGQGMGRHLLRHAEAVARARGAQALYLAVLEANPRGAAFWRAQGFAPTGLSGTQTDGLRHTLHRLRKAL